jgi:hypothetical protein
MDKKTIKIMKKLKILYNNNEFKKTPDDMISSTGFKNYAYITFVQEECNISGAIVLAESIRKLGSMADLVAMITSSITGESIIILKKFFDNVLQVKSKSRELNALNLTKYKKVLLINPDSVVLKYPDYLFTLKTPAGIFIPSKNNALVSDKKNIDLLENFYSCDTISNGIFKGLILLEPDSNKYNFASKKIDFEKEIDYFKLYDTSLWTTINPIFLGLQGFPDWSVLFGLQYGKDKPFILESKISIEERTQSEEYQLWYKFYRDIINKYPELLDSKILSEPNQISKYFSAQLTRKSVHFKKILSSGQIFSVEKIFSIDKVKNYYYYHLDISKEYDSNLINYSFEDDFIINMINDIIKRTNSNYWKKIKKLIPKSLSQISDIRLSNKTNGQILEIFNPNDKENIISYYTKINSNICIIMNISEMNTDDNFWLNNDLIANVFYKKEIELDGYTLKNILFNLLQTLTYNERVEYLNLTYSSTVRYLITLIFYKTIFDSELKSNSKNIYVFSSSNEKARVLSIFLNPNTINKFLTREIVFFTNKSSSTFASFNQIYLNNMLKYQTLKKWVYNNYSGDLIENLIVGEKFKLNNEKPINKIILFDGNTYLKSEQIQQIKSNSIELIEVKFLSNKKDSLNLLNLIDNPTQYYQLDGIKFLL